MSVGAFAATASPAAAQITEAYRPVNPDQTDDDVLTRRQPEFDPVGGRLGSFFLYPRFTVSTGYSDNVLGTPTAAKSDGFSTARADVQLVSDWGRHQLEFLAYGQARRYYRLSTENTEAYGALVNGRYDISHDTAVSANFRADHQPEDRFSVDNLAFTLKPVETLMLNGNVRADKRFGAFAVRGGIQVVDSSYENARTLAGPINETDRNNLRVLYQGSVRYDVTHNAALILAGQYDTINYGRSLFGDRDTTGYRLEAGVGLAITHQLVGDIRVGYLHRDNANPLLRNLSGISFFANVSWSLTRLLSIRLTANRDIENSATLASPGNLRSTGQLSASYEVLRPLIITPAIRVSRIDAIGIEGSNFEKEATFDAIYRLNRQFSISANLRHFDRNAGIFQPVNGNTARVGVALTL
ncbi:outer membrane beta-barrel protein [Sphingomonas sp. UYP23]